MGNEKEKPKLYFVDQEYIEYLLQVDNRVMYNKQGRPYVGAVMQVKDFCYHKISRHRLGNFFRRNVFQNS